MKIGILITGLGVGGAEKHLLKILPKLKHNKFVISLTNKKEVGKYLAAKKIKIYYLGFNKFNILKVIINFRKIIKKENPDVLDTYLIHANIFGRVFGRLFGVNRIISSVRNDYSDLKLLNFLDKYTNCLVDLYVPNSNALVDYIHKKNRIPLNRINVLPNGVEIKRIYSSLNKKYDIRDELKINKKIFVAVCVSRLHKQKNLNTLISAMRLVNKNVVLLLVGKDDGEKKYLKRIVRKYNLHKRVFFTGIRKDVPKILDNSNIFILPSFKEGMSTALLEAMSLKKCCVVSNIPQNTELITEGFNGFVFNPRSEKEIAKKIEKAYKHKNLDDMGERSFKIIKAKYDIKMIIKKYNRIIETVSKRRK